MDNAMIITRILKCVLILAMAGNITSVFASPYDKRHVIIPKLGTYELDNRNQSSGRTFETKSDSVFALEYEYHFKFGLSLGGEIVGFDNTYTKTFQYTAESRLYMGNVKYHFNHQGAFSPFIGAGLGIAYIRNNEEPFVLSHTGEAYQAMVGIDYRFKYVGLHLEYKMVDAEAEDDFGSFTISRIDLGGSGIFAGVSAIF